jgi:hypothetical protein
MKPAAITSMLCLLIGSTANAQLTLLPQVGFENSRTSIEYNNLSSFDPLKAQNSIKANLRLDYRFKSGHSPYIAFGTSPAVVNFSFTDPASAMSNYTAAAGSLQWRLEGGYQFSSKPISFKKNSTIKSSATLTQKTGIKKTCGSSTYKSSCGSKNKTAYTKKDNSLNMRLQPSLGVAYKPGTEKDFVTNGVQYQYNAGNWNTALVTGLGLEFGKGTQRLFTLSTYYTKGLGNLGTQTLNTAKEGKSTTSYFRSNNSSWGMMLGVPFSLIKKKEPVMIKPVTQPPQQKLYYKNKCGYYRSSIRHI